MQFSSYILFCMFLVLGLDTRPLVKLVFFLSAICTMKTRIPVLPFRRQERQVNNLTQPPSCQRVNWERSLFYYEFLYVGPLFVFYCQIYEWSLQLNIPVYSQLPICLLFKIFLVQSFVPTIHLHQLYYITFNSINLG